MIQLDSRSLRNQTTCECGHKMQQMQASKRANKHFTIAILSQDNPNQMETTLASIVAENGRQFCVVETV